MRLEDLEAEVFREVELPKSLWAAAGLLARARSESNKQRALRHDRGVEGNRRVDIHGAFGELLLQRILRQMSQTVDAQSYMSKSMFIATGGAGLANHPDLEFEVDGELFGVDAKTFDCRLNKRYFAIANSKHLGLRGRAHAYFAAISPTNGQRAIISRLIPYDDVNLWPVEKLSQLGSPSRNLPINDFLTRYCPPKSNLADLRSNVYDPKEIDRLTEDPDLKAYLLHLIPTLAGVL